MYVKLTWEKMSKVKYLSSNESYKHSKNHNRKLLKVQSIQKAGYSDQVQRFCTVQNFLCKSVSSRVTKKRHNSYCRSKSYSTTMNSTVAFVTSTDLHNKLHGMCFMIMPKIIYKQPRHKILPPI